ncbi:MAG: hypothetical protein QXO21_01885 [Candidatus Anstonellales archaeon]
MPIFLSQTNKNYKENYDSLFVSYDNVINTLIDQIINRDAIKKSKYYCCYNFAFNHWITNNSLLIDYDEQEEDISKIDKILATSKEIVEIYRSNRESTRYQWPNLTLYFSTVDDMESMISFAKEMTSYFANVIKTAIKNSDNVLFEGDKTETVIEQNIL